jgi:hypothetical protein
MRVAIPTPPKPRLPERDEWSPIHSRFNGAGSPAKLQGSEPINPRVFGHSGYWGGGKPFTMILASAVLTQIQSTVLRTSAGPEQNQRVERMVDRYPTFVWRGLRRLGIPEPELDDATQEVFIVSVRRLADIAPGTRR